ncbi:MAG: hypothetical protein WBN95_01390 [Gammaproteobacteria bacterium]
MSWPLAVNKARPAPLADNGATMEDERSPEQMVIGDKSGIDLSESRPSLQALLKEHQSRLQALPADCPPM